MYLLKPKERRKRRVIQEAIVICLDQQMQGQNIGECLRTVVSSFLMMVVVDVWQAITTIRALRSSLKKRHKSKTGISMDGNMLMTGSKWEGHL